MTGSPDVAVIGLGNMGATFIELSTIDPATMADLAAAAPAGVRVVDCPVSGGPDEARHGTLSLIVAASDDDFIYVHALLAELGRAMHHAGPVRRRLQLSRTARPSCPSTAGNRFMTSASCPGTTTAPVRAAARTVS